MKAIRCKIFGHRWITVHSSKFFLTQLCKHCKAGRVITKSKFLKYPKILGRKL